MQALVWKPPLPAAAHLKSSPLHPALSVTSHLLYLLVCPMQQQQQVEQGQGQQQRWELVLLQAPPTTITNSNTTPNSVVHVLLLCAPLQALQRCWKLTEKLLLLPPPRQDIILKQQKQQKEKQRMLRPPLFFLLQTTNRHSSSTVQHLIVQDILVFEELCGINRTASGRPAFTKAASNVFSAISLMKTLLLLRTMTML